MDVLQQEWATSSIKSRGVNILAAAAHAVLAAAIQLCCIVKATTVQYINESCTHDPRKLYFPKQVVGQIWPVNQFAHPNPTTSRQTHTLT